MSEDRDYQKELVLKYKSQKGFKARIIAKCIECIYDPEQSGTWRQQSQNCTSFECPLYDVRPTSYVSKDAENESE
jgi:hypothetical protein